LNPYRKSNLFPIKLHLQAVALVVWCLPGLNLFTLRAVLYLTMLKQWTVIFLRTLNILVIVNLLLFTFNEFLVVKRPLLYRRINRCRLFGLLIFFSWIFCCLLGTGGLLYRYVDAQPQFSFYVASTTDSNNENYLNVEQNDNKLVAFKVVRTDSKGQIEQTNFKLETSFPNSDLFNKTYMTSKVKNILLTSGNRSKVNIENKKSGERKQPAGPLVKPIPDNTKPINNIPKLTNREKRNRPMPTKNRYLNRTKSEKSSSKSIN